MSEPRKSYTVWMTQEEYSEAMLLDNPHSKINFISAVVCLPPAQLRRLIDVERAEIDAQVYPSEYPMFSRIIRTAQA